MRRPHLTLVLGCGRYRLKADDGGSQRPSPPPSHRAQARTSTRRSLKPVEPVRVSSSLQLVPYRRRERAKWIGLARPQGATPQDPDRERRGRGFDWTVLCRHGSGRWQRHHQLARARDPSVVRIGLILKKLAVTQISASVR